MLLLLLMMMMMMICEFVVVRYTGSRTTPGVWGDAERDIAVFEWTLQNEL